MTPQQSKTFPTTSAISLGVPQSNLYQKAGQIFVESLTESDIPDDFLVYQKDPILFGREKLGETFTEDVAEVMLSVRDNVVTLARSANGVGKCVASTERIMLSDGTLVLAKNLIGKSFLINSFNDKTGEQESSYAYGFDNGKKDVWEITTKSGKKILRTGNHPLWVSWNNSERNLNPTNPGWVETQKIKPGYFIGMPEKVDIKNHVVMPNDQIKLCAYLLGDGGLTHHVTFTQLDGPAKTEFSEIVDNMNCSTTENDITLSVGGDGSRKEGSNKILNLARQWGIMGKNSKEKTFPSWVFKLPDYQLALFLNRLYACDGWAYTGVQKNGRKKIQIGICLANKPMIDDISWALLRLGIFHSVRKKIVTLQGKKFPAWECSITRTEHVIKFCNNIGIFGKDENIANCLAVAKTINSNITWHTKNIFPGFLWEKVKSVRKVGERNTVGITVEKNNTFITKFMEHNTHAAARLAVWFYKCFPGSQVYTAAAPPESNLRRLLWGEINGLVRSNPELFTEDRRISLHIERHSKSFITGVTIPQSGSPEEREAKFSGKHAPYMFFIVDEGDAVPPEVYKGIEACMSGGMVRLLILFNPRRKRGPVYIKERDKQAKVVELSGLRHPNVVTGEDIYPGAVTRAETVRRINEWSRALGPEDEVDAQCFEIPEYLVGETTKARDGTFYKPLAAGWRKIIDPSLSYMVLGKYPPQPEAQLILEEWIEAARSRYDAYVAQFGEVPPEGVMGNMGLDVAEEGLDDNAACFRYGNFVLPLVTWSGVGLEVTGDRGTELYMAKNCKVAKVDATGVGAGVPAQMKRYGRRIDKVIKSIGVKVASKPTQLPEEKKLGEFNKLRDELWWLCREWLKNDMAMLPPDDMLIEELLVPTYSTDGGKIKIMDKDNMKRNLPGGRSPDRAESLILTFAKSSTGWAWGMEDAG